MVCSDEQVDDRRISVRVSLPLASPTESAAVVQAIVYLNEDWQSSCGRLLPATRFKMALSCSAVGGELQLVDHAGDYHTIPPVADTTVPSLKKPPPLTDAV